jgi:hypothetical protein
MPARNTRNTSTPLSDIPGDTLLTPQALCDAMAAMGFPIASQTLAHRRVIGRSIPFIKYNGRVLYKASDALRDLQSRLSPPRTSTSEQV